MGELLGQQWQYLGFVGESLQGLAVNSAHNEEELIFSPFPKAPAAHCSHITARKSPSGE